MSKNSNNTAHYKEALKHALQCFKSQAMTKTHSQLQSECEDILNGQAYLGLSGSLLYFQDLTKEELVNVEAGRKRAHANSN